MKNYLSLLAVVAIVLLTPGIGVKAEDGVNPNQGLRELKLEKKVERLEALTQAKEERREFKVENTENRGNLINFKRGLILRAFSLRISHLESIMARIASRVDKFEEKGIDTSEAEAFLDTAEDALDEAKGEVEEAKEALENGEGVEAIREHVLLAKEALKETHTNLKNAVKSLKAEIEESDDEDEDEDEE